MITTGALKQKQSIRVCGLPQSLTIWKGRQNLDQRLNSFFANELRIDVLGPGSAKTDSQRRWVHETIALQPTHRFEEGQRVPLFWIQQAEVQQAGRPVNMIRSRRCGNEILEVLFIIAIRNQHALLGT